MTNRHNGQLDAIRYALRESVVPTANEPWTYPIDSVLRSLIWTALTNPSDVTIRLIVADKYEDLGQPVRAKSWRHCTGLDTDMCGNIRVFTQWTCHVMPFEQSAGPLPSVPPGPPQANY